MSTQLATLVSRDDLLDLHLPRTLDGLREAVATILHRRLGGASCVAAFHRVEGAGATIELRFGPACPANLEIGDLTSIWADATPQRLPLSYRGAPIGELVARDVSDDAHGWLEEFAAHYATAHANLQLDQAALASAAHYYVGLQTFQDGVVLFQEPSLDVTAARFLQLCSGVLSAPAAALLVNTTIGTEKITLALDQVFGIPEALVKELKTTTGAWWPQSIASQPAQLHVRGENEQIGTLAAAATPAVLRNIVSCPVQYHGVAAGLALLFNVDADDPNFDLKLANLRSLGSLGAALIHRHYLEQDAVRAKLIETQLEVAANIQARLLPSAPPRNSKWQYSWVSRQSSSIGGDYLDLFDGLQGTVQAIVADVSGHGINSALLMTSARAHYRAMAPQMGPAAALSKLNFEVIREVGNTGMFVTGAAMELSADGRRLRFCSAGHNPVMLFRAATKQIELLESSGPPMGFVSEDGYIDQDVAVGPGDVVLLYTDGFTEAVDKSGEEMFGEDRLAEALRKHGHLDALQILGQVVRTIDRFTGRPGSYDDDASMAVVKASA